MTNTGHGALDANGVYLVGELDATGPFFSDFENLGPASISTVLGTLLPTIGRRTSALTPASGTATPVALTYDSLVTNKANGLTASATTGTFVCTTAGSFLFEGMVIFAINASNNRYVMVQKAVAASPGTFVNDHEFQTAAAGTSFEQALPFSDVVTLAVGDVVRIAVANTAGSGTTSVTYAHTKVTKVA